MTITYHYNKTNNIVYTLVKGRFTCEELQKHFSNLIKDEKLLPDFIEVVDMNLASDFETSYSAMQHLVEYAYKLIDLGHRVSLFQAYNSDSQEILSMMSFLFQKVPLTVCLCQSSEETKDNLAILSGELPDIVDTK